MAGLFNEVIIGPNGQLQANTSVNVYNYDTGAAATIYTQPTKAGAGTITQPLSTDANGMLFFWTDPGFYYLSYTDSAGTAHSVDVMVPAYPGDSPQITLLQVLGAQTTGLAKGAAVRSIAQQNFTISGDSGATGRVRISLVTHVETATTSGEYATTNAIVMDGTQVGNAYQSNLRCGGSFPAEGDNAAFWEGSLSAGAHYMWVNVTNASGSAGTVNLNTNLNMAYEG